MSKIKIVKIKNEDKVSTAGKPYSSCSILTISKEGQEVWIGGFSNNTTKSWVVGQEVELEIYKSEANGKEYFNFREVPDRSLFNEIDKLHAKLDLIYGMLLAKKEVKETTVQDCLNEFGGNAPDFLS
jgi:hypothetical protein